MRLYVANKYMQLAYNTILNVRLKIHNGRMSGTERKIHTTCSKPEKYDYIEDVVCKQTDIKENEMKLLPLGQDGGKILLIKQKGELHAIGTKCTHYGALLTTGALGEGRVRCPWHGACFNIKTGDIEDYPGLDSLPCYQVKVDDSGLVHVKAKRKDLDFNRRLKTMQEQDAANKNTVVIVGGGPAAAVCAESLRQESFTGKIVMVCKENTVPYDRIKVSKMIDLDIEKEVLRPPSFYKEHKIDIKQGIEAIGLNTSENIVHLSNNEKLPYNYLFICTGSKPRIPDNIPGVNLANIHVLRTYTDTQAIRPILSPDKHVVVLGLGFIGLEAAATYLDKCASITIVGRNTVPLEPVFGTDIGNRIKRVFDEKGIKFKFECNIAQFNPKEGEPKTVGSAVLTNGEVLPADIVILGIGSTLYTEWLKSSPIEMLKDGSIKVDKYLKTNVENVYAGGDVAYAPLYGSDDISAAIGHFPLAHYHGKIAALNIAGKKTVSNTVPFFWTMLFGKGYRYAGHGKPDSVKIYGSLDNLEFIAYYIKDGKVIAVSSAGADPVVSDFANLLYEGRTLTQEDIDKDPFAWIKNKPKDFETKFKNKL